MLSQCGRTLSACLWQHRASRLLDLVRCLFCLSSPCHFWKPQRFFFFLNKKATKIKITVLLLLLPLSVAVYRHTEDNQHFSLLRFTISPLSSSLWPGKWPQKDVSIPKMHLKETQSLQEELPFIDNPNYGCWSCYEHCFIYLTEAIIQ